MMNLKRRALLLISLLILFVVGMHSCKKDKLVGDNPYNSIHRDDTTKYGIPVDSLTITYVHKKLLLPRCAQPGCHDGNFEPDYRTPQSAFSTLVYAPIIKNNTQGTFKFRVIPFDTTHSVLHERLNNCCFVNANDRMPQDLIGVALPDSSLNLISEWIMHGARDMFGNVAHLPNAEPVIGFGYAAFDTVSLIPPFAFPSVFYQGTRLDSVPYNPFIVPASKSVFYMSFKITDDSTAENQLLVNKLKVSTDADNFTSAFQYNALYVNFGNGNSGYLVTIPTNNLPQNDTLYMRYYVNDGDHPNNTEFPRSELAYPYKTFWSFIRQ
jgi:hypothetical protein